jgi:hypothetical protein
MLSLISEESKTGEARFSRVFAMGLEKNREK